MQEFEKNFSGQILINKRQWYDEKYYGNKKVKIVSQINFDRENDLYLKGIEYLSSISILSRCNALVSGNCWGANSALFMNNMKYEYWELFDIGLY